MRTDRSHHAVHIALYPLIQYLEPHVYEGAAHIIIRRAISDQPIQAQRVGSRRSPAQRSALCMQGRGRACGTEIGGVGTAAGVGVGPVSLR